MQCEVIRGATMTAVRPPGRIDSATAAAFMATLVATVRGTSEPVDVDLSRVAYLSSAGLRALWGKVVKQANIRID